VAHCEATSVERENAGFRVVTSTGEVRAGEVVLATNGYTTSRPSVELRRRIVPVGSYIIVTEPVEDLARELFPGGAMTYTKKRLLNYMRRTPDGRILIGGRRNLHTGLDLEQSAAGLRGQLIGYFPWLREVDTSHVWGGKLAVPFDLVPHMGKVDGMWYALGYAGHGVGLSTLMGHELGGMLLGEDPPSVFTKVPHPTRFYYRGNPWFLTPASVLYRTLDRLGR
jgi:glycine/D-amino acid oxidase-like deaminating enzyme